MTALRIDTVKFKEACEEVRYRMTATDDLTVKMLAKGARNFYETVIDDEWRAQEDVEIEEADPVEALRASLNTSAMSAQQYGATQAQINYIVSLAVAKNDFNILSGGRLTKSEASKIISEMKGN